jgi:hypothetical protein
LGIKSFQLAGLPPEVKEITIKWNLSNTETS